MAFGLRGAPGPTVGQYGNSYLGSPTRGLTVNRIFLMPVRIYGLTPISSFTCQLNTAAAGNLRMGIYKLVGTNFVKVCETADISTAATGVKTGAPTSPTTLQPGTYFVFFIYSSGVGVIMPFGSNIVPYNCWYYDPGSYTTPSSFPKASAVPYPPINPALNDAFPLVTFL